MKRLVATISVPQEDANKVLLEKLEHGKRYTPKEIKQVLIENFEGINKDQCTSTIYRSYRNSNGVLAKVDKFYLLRPDSDDSLTILDKAKHILVEALHKIERIPSSEVKTVEQYKELSNIRKQINLLIGNE
ncbi:hypothetical protein COF68_05075 [Bacillus toyonensis]|uniref:hypothetical protein n=1 Tax=Bacillus toyonensis TaxID=155322 RepID=UPI000BFD2791|nr:hypothetical protein [Bacillus toyonensis]PHE64219.1 hypothetical protein COF68_05075 [Bacillus toyonensis]